VRGFWQTAHYSPDLITAERFLGGPLSLFLGLNAVPNDLRRLLRVDRLVDTQAAGFGAVQVAPRIRSIPPGVLSQTSTLSMAFQHRVAALEPH